MWDSCESTLCNAHVGMGFDLHHHGNPGPSEQCMYDNATGSIFYGTLSVSTYLKPWDPTVNQSNRQTDRQTDRPTKIESTCLCG